MSTILFGALSSITSLLFKSTDELSLGSTMQTSSIALSSSGLTTTLGVNGVSLNFPSGTLSAASQAGNLTFSDGTHLVVGKSSADTMHATPGENAMYGLDGNDNMTGGASHDNMMGGAGSDTLDGGDGNDHLYGYGASVGVDGADSITGGAGNDYIQGNAGDDTLDGGDGSDRIFGGQGNDRISGGVGNDFINGNFGDDVIDAGEGNDWVRGGKGDDAITGGAGDDTILGDLGADVLTGGSGSDLFQFRGNDAAGISLTGLLGKLDTITDFSAGDHISLGFAPRAIYDGGVVGTLGDALTWATTTLTGHGGDVAAITVGSDTMLFYSSTGGALPDSVIELHGAPQLSLDSFLL